MKSSQVILECNSMSSFLSCPLWANISWPSMWTSAVHSQTNTQTIVLNPQHPTNARISFHYQCPFRHWATFSVHMKCNYQAYTICLNSKTETPLMNNACWHLRCLSNRSQSPALHDQPEEKEGDGHREREHKLERTRSAGTEALFFSNSNADSARLVSNEL